MKVSLTPLTLTNLGIAETQLLRAISLFIDEKDFVSSLTLAGAAEEILGKMLRLKGEKNRLDELVDESISLGDKLADIKSKEKDVVYLLNYYRNRLKHYDDNEPINYSAEHFSAEIISRAIENYKKYTKQETQEMVTFRKLVIDAPYEVGA